MREAIKEQIGDLEKAEIVKQKIITVVENIRLQYPYLNEI